LFDTFFNENTNVLKLDLTILTMNPNKGCLKFTKKILNAKLFRICKNNLWYPAEIFGQRNNAKYLVAITDIPETRHTPDFIEHDSIYAQSHLCKYDLLKYEFVLLL